MGSLASRAQPWPRARPAYVAHARSSRTALAHQADRGAQGVILTVLSTKGTSISCGSGACVARARPVSAPPTMTPRPPRPSSHHSACAPAAHSPLHCARLFAAQYREADRQHQHHWLQGRRSLLRRRRLGPRRFYAPRERCRCCEVACEAAWSCQAPLKAAVAAQAQCTFVRAALAVCPRVCGGSGDAIFAENAVRDSLCSAQKNGERPMVIFHVVRTSVRVSCISLTPFTPLYTRVCVV